MRTPHTQRGPGTGVHALTCCCISLTTNTTRSRSSDLSEAKESSVKLLEVVQYIDPTGGL